MSEEYNEFGEIKKPVTRLSTNQQHRIHQTKDMFEGDCSLCQADAKKGVKTYWKEDV